MTIDQYARPRLEFGSLSSQEFHSNMIAIKANHSPRFFYGVAIPSNDKINYHIFSLNDKSELNAEIFDEPKVDSRFVPQFTHSFSNEFKQTRKGPQSPVIIIPEITKDHTLKYGFAISKVIMDIVNYNRP